MAKAKWPEEVPVLSAKDFVQGPYYDWRTGARCTLGWCDDTFPGIESKRIDAVLVGTAKECGAKFSEFVNPNCPTAYSDDKRNSKRLVARIWNRAMMKLGYVVGNPEAKNI